MTVGETTGFTICPYCKKEYHTSSKHACNRFTDALAMAALQNEVSALRTQLAQAEARLTAALMVIKLEHQPSDLIKLNKWEQQVSDLLAVPDNSRIVAEIAALRAEHEAISDMLARDTREAQSLMRQRHADVEVAQK